MPARLTYCGNVHPAEDLATWCAMVDRHAAPLAAAQPAPMGLGVWWNAACAAELGRDEAARARVAACLARHGLTVWTANVFPYGAFHADRVKESVYRPAWDDPARLRYTLDVAAAVAALGRPGDVVPLSTLPLGYRGGDRPAMARALGTAAASLAALEDATGVRCVLALEPEPFCLLETAAAAADFLEREVFAGAPDPRRRRRHLGVCIDLCHAFIVGEDPLAALADLRGRGIEVPKLQVSSCLELRDGLALDALLAFDEPRYLHQTVAAAGARALDLPEVAARRAEFAAAGVLRTHFHVPVFWDADGPLGSTRREVERVLHALPRLPPPLPLLEVETYTWSVLPPGSFGAGDLDRGLAAELEFARRLLAP